MFFSIISLIAGIATHASAASNVCEAQAKSTLVNSIKSFGITQAVKMDNLEPAAELTNSFGEKVLKYDLPAFKLDDSSYIPESGASIVLRKSDCQVLKLSIDVFSGLN